MVYTLLSLKSKIVEDPYTASLIHDSLIIISKYE